MTPQPVTQFVHARREFHAALLLKTLTINAAGVPSNADKDSRGSVAIAQGIANLLKAELLANALPARPLATSLKAAAPTS